MKVPQLVGLARCEGISVAYPVITHNILRTVCDIWHRNEQWVMHGNAQTEIMVNKVKLLSE
jgi:hypothetical protein